MGLFDKRRPEQEQAAPAETWQADRARVASFLYRARTFNGTGPEDPTLTVNLKPGERALLVATGTFLVEPRRVPAHWTGDRGGFRFRVAPRAAQPAGHEAAAGLAPVDSGDITFTDKRIVFSGTHKCVEWEYADLLGLFHVDHPPWTVVCVSGRDGASGFRYDEGQAEEVRFAIVLGLARFNDAVDSLLADLQEQLDEIDRAHSPATAATPTSSTAQAALQTWQGPPEGGLGEPAAAPSTSSGPSPAAAWPPPDPFPPATAGAAAPGPAESGAGFASAVPRPASSYSPDESATVIDGVSPGVSGQPVEAAIAESGAQAPSPSPGEIFSRALSEQDTTEPKPAEDTGVPTGQIPALSPNPTATYPAVQPQPAAPVQPVQPVHQAQQAQPAHQGAPSTPPGWYPDPWRVARVRWWDGYSWTSYTSH